MARKLYYEDPEQTQFVAAVTGCAQTAKGFEITLDATLFYPEGGGQACDTGVLGGVRVLDVRERDEEIIHLCDGPLAVGEKVEGAVDWDRRFDLMQQHTGEHILSGLIHQTFGYHNVGFHMGNGLMEVDFDGPITEEQMADLEARANAIVWENRPVATSFPDPETLAVLPYRTKKALDWPVRIVEVPGADCCACCGIHVPFTGRVGIIKVFSVTKFHSGVRLQMACGKRAYEYMTMICGQNRQVSRVFSAQPHETGAAAQRFAETLAAEKYRAAGLQNRLLELIAASMEGRGNVVCFEAGLDSTGVRTLAEKIAGRCSGYAAVFSGSEGSYGFCLARPGGDLRQLCKEMNGALNGRGGGRPEFQQGTLRATRAQIEEFFQPRT